MAMEGTVIRGDAQTWFEGAALDSRSVTGGELFFALAGEHTDGHRFVGDALGRGATGAVIDRALEEIEDPGDDGVLIQVDDTFDALHALTRHVRREVPRKLVAITGSAGKTTTKELLATMLGRRYRVAKSLGNLNNLYGFPISLLAIPDDTEWMVAEMGMSTPGELAGVSRLGRPDVAVLTNVRPAHLESFEERAAMRGEARAALDLLRAVGDAKAELFEGLSPEGTVVANAGDPEVVRVVRGYLASRTGEIRVVWYGLDEERAADPEVPLDVWAKDLHHLGPDNGDIEGMGFTLESRDGEAAVTLALHGVVNVENFLAAAATAWALGLRMDEIAATAERATPLPGRGRIHRLGRDICLIDDSYNSNPAALDRALDAARELEGRRHWVILGDMLELGSGAPDFHRRAGERAAALGFAFVLGVGALARHLVDGAVRSGADGEWLADAAAASVRVEGMSRPGDVILVKGSRGVGLEVVVDALLRDAAAGSSSDAGGDFGRSG